MVEESIHGPAFVHFFADSPVMFSVGETPRTQPTKVGPSRTELADSTIIAEWGDENNFPLKLRKEKEANPDLGSALDWKARALYAGGLHYVIRDRFTKEPMPDSPEIRRLTFEIDQFLFRNRQYLAQACVDLYDLNNVFAQIIISEDRKKIHRIHALEAQDCRFGKRTPGGDIKHIYLHPDWMEWNGQEADDKIKKVAAIHPHTVSPEEIKEQKGEAMKFIFPVAYPTGKNYYQYPQWWSVKKSKWLDFANMIPTVKEAILRNMALIRYHIQMPDYWMQERYKDWGKMTDKQKEEATKKEFQVINDVLHKPENAGKSVYTTFKVFQASGKEYGGWKIEAVDDKMKDGALLADSSEATIKVFSATSIDPSLHGLIPGKGGSNRSGSDKREALNIYMSLIQVHEDIILDPWQFASWYNWNNETYEVHWFLKKPLLQTLNQVTPSNRQTIPEDADQ